MYCGSSRSSSSSTRSLGLPVLALVSITAKSIPPRSAYSVGSEQRPTLVQMLQRHAAEQQAVLSLIGMTSSSDRRRQQKEIFHAATPHHSASICLGVHISSDSNATLSLCANGKSQANKPKQTEQSKPWNNSIVSSLVTFVPKPIGDKSGKSEEAYTGPKQIQIQMLVCDPLKSLKTVNKNCQNHERQVLRMGYNHYDFTLK